MLLYILTLVFISLAAICNSVMDKISFHYYKFKFKDRLNQQWWNPLISWKNKYENNDPKLGFKYIKFLTFKFKFPIFLTDAWHFFQSAMIFLYFLAIIFSNNYSLFNLFNIEINFLFLIIEKIIVFSTVYILTFNIFFNKILEK